MLRSSVVVKVAMFLATLAMSYFILQYEYSIKVADPAEIPQKILEGVFLWILLLVLWIICLVIILGSPTRAYIEV